MSSISAGGVEVLGGLGIRGAERRLATLDQRLRTWTARPSEESRTLR